MNAHALSGADFAVNRHRFFGVDVLAFHEPARLVGAYCNQR